MFLTIFVGGGGGRGVGIPACGLAGKGAGNGAGSFAGRVFGAEVGNGAGNCVGIGVGIGAGSGAGNLAGCCGGGAGMFWGGGNWFVFRIGGPAGACCIGLFGGASMVACPLIGGPTWFV